MNLNIQKNVPLAQYTTFKIGGPAKFFAEIKTKKDLTEAIEFARTNKLEIFVLSGGSNILVSDKGFDGLVIQMRNTEIEINGQKISCGSGAKFSEIVLKSIRSSLSGLEWAIGVPGNIGGAVRGNAGCFGGEISQVVKEVEAFDMDKQEFRMLKKNECGFSYRSSIFKENKELVIFSVLLELELGEQKESRNKIRDIVLKRNAAQPKYPSAGSFFKNPSIENDKLIERFENDTKSKAEDGIIPAAWLIEETGLKGKKIGGAQISEKHANFVINSGQATAEDVIILSSFIKQQVRDELGVQLQEEVQLIGF